MTDLGETSTLTFTNDLFKEKKLIILWLLYIMANPPFNLKGWRDADELSDDSRFDDVILWYQLQLQTMLGSYI